MGEKENIAIVKSAYEAFAKGDLDGALSSLAEDTKWTVPGNSAISGTYANKGEVTELLVKLSSKGFATSPETWLADGDKVVVLTTVTADGRSSHAADIWTVRDGKATAYQGINDTALQEEIWGTK